MRWIQEFEKRHKEGARAFLFTGSVSDGFPLLERSAETDPVDRLDTWHKALSRRLHVQEIDIVWFFDPALGFRFPKSTDEKKPSMEQRFRALANGETPPTGALSPAEKAAQALQQEMPLPTEPLEALGLMHKVFDRATVVASDKKAKVGRCIAIMPDFDAVCSGALGGTDRATERIALLVMRIAENDRFARAGHLMLMSARTLSALPERLRRPESPIVPITIMPPDEEERLRFISSLTDETSLKQAELNKLEARLNVLRQAEQQRIHQQILLQDEQLAELNRQGSTLVQENVDIQARQRSLEAAQARMTAHLASGASALEQEITSLRTQISQLEHRLREDPELQPQLLNASRWQTLLTNDLITLRSPTDGKIQTTRVLSDADADGDVRLTTLTDDTPWLNKQGQTVYFNWSASSGLVCHLQKGDTLKRVQGDTPFEYTLQRGERSRLETSLAEARKRFEGIQQNKNTVVQQIQAEMDALQEQIRKQTQAVCAEINKYRKACESAKQELQASHDHPSTSDIKQLEKEAESIRVMMQNMTTRNPFPTPTIGIQSLTQLTGNLGYRDLTTLFREASANTQDLSAVEVTSRRIALLTKTYGDLLEIERPPYGFDGVAGLDGVKEYFIRVRDAMLAGDVRRVPMGCLLMGPPGTGKSALATALAHEAGVLLVKTRPIRSKWVGETEQKMEQLFIALRALAPLVWFRDEVDQEDNGRDGYQGDSGVSNRVRQAMMQFLSDPTIRGRIFVVSATNRPDLLDGALKRAGRTDDRIPILMPDHETRTRLFPVMIKRYGFESPLTDFATFAEKTDGLTGADIEVLVRRADQFGGGNIDEKALTGAIEDYLPSASVAEIARMTLLAIQNCSSKLFLPENVKGEIERALRMLRGLPASSEPIPEINPALIDRNVGEA